MTKTQQSTRAHYSESDPESSSSEAAGFGARRALAAGSLGAARVRVALTITNLELGDLQIGTSLAMNNECLKTYSNDCLWPNSFAFRGNAPSENAGSSVSGEERTGGGGKACRGETITFHTRVREGGGGMRTEMLH